jgi:rubrerythrin
MTRPVESIADFYANALAIEQEAARKYREYHEHFAACGESALARICLTLAKWETLHFEALRVETQGMALPAVPTESHRWTDSGSPEGIEPGATPRSLLEIALRAERRAQRYFERMASSASDPALRAAAGEMSSEEAHHVHWMTAVLDHLGVEGVDWSRLVARYESPSQRN